jgi:hypothetical protein
MNFALLSKVRGDCFKYITATGKKWEACSKTENAAAGSKLAMTNIQRDFAGPDSARVASSTSPGAWRRLQPGCERGVFDRHSAQSIAP